MTPENTSVVILAAGRGTRMRALTDHTPKPLLKVGAHTLIEHHLKKLRAEGFKKIVINVDYLGAKIIKHVGDGKRFKLDIQYSNESDTGALETAGGLRKALPLIASDPFLVINADIFTDFDFAHALAPLSEQADLQGRLVLVKNPPQNPKGDFLIKGANANIERSGDTTSAQSRTFSGIAVYRKSLFSGLPPGKQALGPILKTMVANQQLDLIEHFGEWNDVGTPERFAQLNAEISH